jgi:hypothetical protein
VRALADAGTQCSALAKLYLAAEPGKSDQWQFVRKDQALLAELARRQVEQAA